MPATISRRALERHAFIYEPGPGDLKPSIILVAVCRRRVRLAAAKRRRRLIIRLGVRPRRISR